MALTSPGVEVTIIDQSQYLPASTNSVPLVILATAQNKANPAGTGVAPGTTAANAGKLYQVTSQKDLVDLYGTPFFYTTTNGTPIQGYELNEYGLLAAYSLLGSTNRCYVLRADINLASLVGSTSRPTSAVADGTYWVDTTRSDWGIYEFNATTGAFTLQIPIVITDPNNLSDGIPIASIGNINQYAINAVAPTLVNGVYTSPSFTYFHKNNSNNWVTLGNRSWCRAIPTVQGTATNPVLTAGDEFTINVNGQFNITVQVPSSPNDNVSGVVNAINNKGFSFVTAGVVSGRLYIYSSISPAESSYYLNLTNTNVLNDVLGDLGITANKRYYQPQVVIGNSAEMPLWTASQLQPHPTGSVWIKTGKSGLGFYPAVSIYSTTKAAFSAKSVAMAESNWEATYNLDATGGQAIPAGTIYAQYNYDGQYTTGSTRIWERVATGPTVVTGSATDITFATTGDIYVQVSIPNNAALSSQYTVSITSSNNATDFVTAWTAANIPYTTATVTTSGAIQLTHTKGGEIVLNDYITTAGATKGTSSGLIAAAGFATGAVYGTNLGPINTPTFTVSQTSTSGSGTSATFYVFASYPNNYMLPGTGVASAGTGYAVGDTITIAGTKLGGATTTNDLVLRVASISGLNPTGPVTSVSYVSGNSVTHYTVQLSNWQGINFISQATTPTAIPTNGTNWFYSAVDQVDIMVQSGGQWNGYRNVNYDSTGFPSATGSNTTDPNGPIVSATQPITQSDGTSLVYGDLWINTSAEALEMYPVISRWQSVNMIDQWVLLDNADQTSSKGVAFLDARWGSSGAINPVEDAKPTIVSLLSSDYIDLDAPSPALYPTGMLLFNTRRSGYNVKQFKTNVFTQSAYPDAGAYNPSSPTNINNLPEYSYTWVSVSGLEANGSAYMGRKAQRNMVVESLRSVVVTNNDIRDEDNFFNLIATPNYPELQPEMVVLNTDRNETGYIIGDTPMRLPANATAVQAWATNAAGAQSTGEDGCVTRNTYLGLFYPSGLASDLAGNIVAVPPSHMMLRTFLRNDTVAYPWLAPAGTRRGNIINATNIGYLNSVTGEFITIKTNIGLRDVLYINFINPLVFFTGIGLLNYGNKTSYNSTSALDRINVARLVAYIKRQLTIAARPFVFEPNDALTRQQIAGVIQTLMVDLVAKRGLYDYLVVCDGSNNTPARIDRNELWVDVAIEPVKAAEFIYIPVRVLNTGEIAGLK
jgi:hypothetical protein